jgi:hypothetical protein
VLDGLLLDPAIVLRVRVIQSAHVILEDHVGGDASDGVGVSRRDDRSIAEWRVRGVSEHVGVIDNVGGVFDYPLLRLRGWPTGLDRTQIG